MGKEKGLRRSTAGFSLNIETVELSVDHCGWQGVVSPLGSGWGYNG